MNQNWHDLGLGAGLPMDRLADLELVSAGGQGLVYRARDLHLDRWVAIKLLTKAPTEGDLPKSVAAQAQMSWHPHVMTLHDAGRATSGHVYLIMEYLEGGSCEQMRKRGPVAEARALRLGCQVAEALQAIHEHGFSHCDVKPSNILLDLEDNAHLGDFGSTHRIGEQTATLNGAEGSPMFVAPEVLDGGRAGRSADVFALAVTLRTLLTGDQPYTATHSLAEAIALRLQSGRLSFGALVSHARLRGLLEAATDNDPERRPQMSELLSELHAAEGNTPVVVPVPPSKRPRRTMALVAAMSLIAGAIGGWIVRAEPSHQHFCDALVRARTAQIAAIAKVNALLPEGTESIGFPQMEALLKSGPEEVAAGYEPVLAAANATTLRDDVRTLPENALSNMVLADLFSRVQDNQAALIDTQRLKVNELEEVSPDVVATARTYVDLLKYGRDHCDTSVLGEQEGTLTTSIRSLVTTIQELFVSGRTDKFFSGDSEARSTKLFTKDVVDVLLSFSLAMTEVERHRDWFALLLDAPAVRATVINHHFRALLRFYDEAGAVGPTPTWAAEVKDRWDNLTAIEQRSHQLAAQTLELELPPEPPVDR